MVFERPFLRTKLPNTSVCMCACEELSVCVCCVMVFEGDLVFINISVKYTHEGVY